MSTLIQQAENDLRNAMRQKDERRVGTLRLLLTALRKEEKDRLAEDHPSHNVPFDNAAALQVIRREIKKRTDAADLYRKANRADRAEQELAENQILEGYLPRQLSRDELAPKVQEIVAEHGKDFTKVIKIAMAQLRSQADGRLITEVVREMVQS